MRPWCWQTPETRRTMVQSAPEVVVHDILTLAPALAGELEGLPVATLIPHVHPAGAPGFPPYAFGARLPRRTSLGRALWRAMGRPVPRPDSGRGRAELNETRAALGLAPVARLHGGISPRAVHRGPFPAARVPPGRPARFTSSAH